MIKLIKKILRKLLPNFLYLKLKKIYSIIKYKNYDLSKDLDYNENLFKLFKLDNEKIKSRLNSLNFQYHDRKLSWHYHLFAGLKDYFGNKKINILEIGTYKGKFSNFISKIYDESHIITIDLDESDKQFIDTYNRKEKSKLDKFLKIRNKNLNRKNIDFIKLNSSNIKEYFKGKKFDLIWVDGDHLNPQLEKDILNSLNILHNHGILCTDDVIMDHNFKKTKYVSNEGFFILKQLENNGLIKNYFLNKRIRMENAIHKKYVSVSTFKDNTKFII